MISNSITVKQWKDLVAFEPINKDGILDVDGTIKHIATVQGKSVEELENEIAVEDLLPTYINCVHEVNSLVYSKLNVIPKNGSGDSTM